MKELPMKKIKCINNSIGMLTVGKVYAIMGGINTGVTYKYYILDDSLTNRYYCQTLFEDIEQKKIVCNDARIAAQHCIVWGKVYEVSYEGNTHYEFTDHNGSYRILPKNCFTEVNQTNFTGILDPNIIRTAYLPKIENEEDRLRKLLSPKIESHECPCGMTRSLCDYHR